MLEKTSDDLKAIEIPAISVQYSVGFGQDRQLTLTTGVPLDADPSEINPVLDKIVSAVERQRVRYTLEQTRMALLNAEQDVHQYMKQYADQEAGYMAEWAAQNKRGDWRPFGNQKQQLENLNKNRETSAERVRQLRKTIGELEEKCR